MNGYRMENTADRSAACSPVLTFGQVEALLRQMPILYAQQTCALDPAQRTQAADMVKRMTEAISFLPDPCRRVLQTLYMDQKTWIQAETQLFMARNTLARHRRKGIELLQQMLNGPQAASHEQTPLRIE